MSVSKKFVHAFTEYFYSGNFGISYVYYEDT